MYAYSSYVTTMKPETNLQVKYKQNYKISKIQMNDTNAIFSFYI